MLQKEHDFFFIDFNCSLTVDMHTSFRIIIDKKWRKRKPGKNKDSYITSVRSQFNLYVPDHLMYLIYIKKLKIDYNSYLAVFDQQNDITPNFQKIRSNSIPVDFSKKRRKIITHTFILKDQSVCTCLKYMDHYILVLILCYLNTWSINDRQPSKVESWSIAFKQSFW